MTGFEPSAQEQQVIKAVFAKADTQDLGVVTGDEAVKVFAGSGLPPATLGEIWQLSDTENNGFLTDAGLGIALRLIGWAQAGETPKKELITRVGPLPTIKGIPIPGVSSNPGSPMPLARSPPPSLPARPAMPPLTPDDRQKFLRMFFQSGPSQGLLSGDKARDLFLRSKLPTEKLSQIWHLADTHERGSLDSTDFIIGMFLIQSVMTGALQILPPSLPPGLYEQASGGASRPSVGSPLQAQFTGTSTGSRASPAFPQRAASPIRAQYTGQPPLQPQYTGQRGITPQYTGQSQFSQNASVLRPQMTGQPFAIPQAFSQPKWDVTAEEKAKSDSFFATLDPQGRGFIEGDVAVAFMVQSKLPEAILAQVWDLSDLNHDGKLTRDGFAVAMHLINGKLAGREVPNELPQSLIPPSYRGGAPAPAPAQPTQSETIRDLWSLDEPVQTPTPPAAAPLPAPTSMPPAMTMPAPQPQRNLFDDDDDDEPASPAVTSPAPNGTNKAAAATQSIEIANVQNQLASTQRALDSTTAQRQAASASADATAADLASLKEQLARATAARATEETHLAEIRTRKVAQDAELAKVREELIRVESEASATRIERGELETGLLRDKEELRAVQRKVGEVSEEVERAKGEVEKFKRETRQIKGMLAIARKQLGTVEGEKAKIEKEGEDVKKEGEEARQELEDVERQVAEGHAEPAIVAPVPTINGAATLSPQATGNLDRLSPAQVELPISRAATPADKAPQRAGSTNPFDRLRGASSSALPFGDVPANASPFGTGAPTSPFSGPGSPDATASFASPTVISPFGAPEGSSAFDAVFGDSFTEPAKPTDDSTANLAANPAPVANNDTPKPPIPARQPSTGGIADDGDPFGMDAEEPEDKPKPAEPTQDKGKAPEPTQDKGKANELEQTKESETTHPAETNNIKALEDPDVAAAVSQFPALSLQNTPARKSEDLPPLTELEPQEDSDSDDEPLDQQAKRKGLGEPEPAPVEATTPTPAPAASPFPAAAASASPFPAPAAATSPFPVPTTSAPAPAASAFDDAFGVSSPVAPAPTGASAFDEAFKTIPSNHQGETSKPAFGFENSFDDNFDFASATKDEGTASGFTAMTQNTASPTVPGAFSFDDAFGTGNTSMTSQGKPESVSAKGQSFDEAFGLSGSTTSKPDTGSAKPSFDAFGSAFSSGPRSAPPPEPVPIPTPVRAPGTASTMSRPSPPTSPTATSTYSGRASSPRNSKRSESPKAVPRMRLDPPPEPAQRHSKLSLHFPSFGRSKTTKDKSKGKKDKGAKEPIPDLPSPMPSTSSAAPTSGTPAVDDDVEAVKTLCGMGFTRTQAVNALETHGYDVQKALNSLLGA